MGRKVVPDKGRLPVTKTLEFPSCTGNTFFLRTGTERTERQKQAWWQGTIKGTKGKGDYLKGYPFFDWEPVKLLEKWFNMLMSAFAEKRLLLHDFYFHFFFVFLF